MILYAARGSILEGCPGVPSLLRKILQDATIYFLLMFVCQLLLLFFLFLAPVGPPAGYWPCCAYPLRAYVFRCKYSSCLGCELHFPLDPYVSWTDS